MRPAELPRAAVALPRSAKKGPTRGQGSSLARPAWAVAEFGRRGRCSDEKGPATTGCSDAPGCVAFGQQAMARFFLCLAAAACCLVLLVPPVHGRLGIGRAGGLGAANRHTAAEEQQRGTAVKAASSAWSTSWTAAAASGRVRPELRSVPGGPDPLHHHGSPWRPELEPTTP
ncbi:hypothetical protein GQ55_8G219500 [Panicum hallii var. hallii]|uniref:Uncharacterized protein n=2 Tax=Panicum hallii TaxID=206008 RepID=A0A2T7CPZ5_9POAL|nr:hypothetical protein GQ55_8G219500 [Panicum hallii var. hallii]